MPFKDLREFIARLEEEGEAVRIEEEVDWNLEASAVLRRLAMRDCSRLFPLSFRRCFQEESQSSRSYGTSLLNTLAFGFRAGGTKVLERPFI